METLSAHSGGDHGRDSQKSERPGTGTLRHCDPSEPEPPPAASPASPLPANLTIGNYRIVRQLGPGGMGIVYEAEQQHPKRPVALKVIKGGRFVDEQHVKLFEREVQALARLKHPGIAAIYESGRTTEGQHFFAMELVRGETLKDYLEKANLSGPLTPVRLRERLIIFRKISDAVTYAHQRGVIHRDLKPANIVLQRDFESSGSESGPMTPNIKILDFGLARITDTDLAVATVGTEIGMIRGTLPYMSPEQLRGNPDEIDVRSDVYSLGVILYEMIAGHLPYDVRHVMLHEAVKVICDAPPAPLSKSWTGTKKLDRDLETIVDKALDKPVARCYQSVSALGDDVSRFLTAQPILARPPSMPYQLQKLVARHRLGFGFAAALMVLITVFAVVTSIQAQRIGHERDRANREAQISKQVSGFMQTLFQAPDPFRGKGKEVTAREILDQGSARIAVELKDQPEVQTELALLMGESYFGLGLYDKAAELAQMAIRIGRSRLGNERAAVADALNTLGVIKMDQGDFVISETLMQESLDIRRKLFGSDHILVAEGINNIADLNRRKGDWKKAEADLRESLAIYRKATGDESEQVATLLNNLAVLLKDQEKFTEAMPLYQEALSMRRKILGSNHPLVASSLNNLAMLYMRVKDYPAADKLFQEALTVDRKVLGEFHSEVSRILNNLGTLNDNRGRLSQAEDYYMQSITIDQKLLGENNPLLAGRLQNLGVVLTRQKKFKKAEEHLRKAVSLKLLQFAPDHWEVATTHNFLGSCLVDQKKYKEAEPLVVESYSIIKKQFGMQHSRTRVAGSCVIALYDGLGRNTEADTIRTELGMTR